MSTDPLAKDCQCVTHDGPHWLHMQMMDRARLRRTWDDAGEHPSPALAGHVAREGARLEGELAQEMERRGIAVLPGAVVQRVRQSHERWVAGLALKREAQRRDERARRAEQKKRDAARLAEMAAEYETATKARRREIEAETPKLQRSWWGPE